MLFLRNVEFLKDSEVATMRELVGFIVWLTHIVHKHKAEK